jgi:hypothetical protein
MIGLLFWLAAAAAGMAALERARKRREALLRKRRDGTS